jgi:dTDP-4-dehydrorhamnose 3,5-epimerase-like enzyme
MTQPTYTRLETTIPGLIAVRRPVLSPDDPRGSVTETFNQAAWERLGIPHDWALSHETTMRTKKGALRGVHGGLEKLVSLETIGSVAKGYYLDYRIGSPTYGHIDIVEIDENTSVFVPKGVGNSIQAITDSVYVIRFGGHWSYDSDKVRISFRDNRFSKLLPQDYLDSLAKQGLWVERPDDLLFDDLEASGIFENYRY